VAAGLPLSTLLSQALVAFPIELDNEFERQVPHRTSKFKSRDGPWLVSMVMWWNCMRFVGEEGIQADELEQQRWQARFGLDLIPQLRESQSALGRQVGADLPDCLPILGFGLFSRAQAGSQNGADVDLPLSALLSRALLAFAIEFERESDLSLAISANVLRVLNENGAPVRDLPILTGVSKQAISMALSFLRKKRLSVVEPDPAGSRAKIVRLTPKGRAAQDAHLQLIEIIEARWKTRCGGATIRVLGSVLEKVVSDPAALDPYPDGWRAQVPKPVTLPHYPMVLHRGGFPDGS
jgi:DNA-binding MarR family transcriptional regulator